MPRYEVRDWIDVLHVQRCTSQIAASLGFSKRECGELAIVASELSSNILKYGVRGSLEVTAVRDERGDGISLVATDSGRPFHDLSAALKDGYDDRGPIDPLDMLKRKGIGGGLGAVVRLTHRFWVEPSAEGKAVHAVRYLPAGRRSRRPQRRGA